MAPDLIETPELAARLDRTYRWQRHVYDLTRKHYLLGRDRLIAELAPPDGGHVLEIGCGTARNLICAAHRWPRAHFYGVDLSSVMLQSARQSLARGKLADRIAVAEGDATSFDPTALFGRPQFNRIFFSYSLSMIPHWQAALAHAAPLLAPRGTMHVVDFGRSTALPGPVRSILRWWLAQFHVSPRDDLQTEMQRLADRRGMQLRFDEPYRTYISYATLGAGV